MENSSTKRRALISVTEAAAARIRTLMSNCTEDGIVGLRVGVDTKGCSGLAYKLDYAKSIGPMDEVVEAGGTKIIIDPGAVMFLAGSEMDYVETTVKSGFEFINPNEAGRCGCGESFFVDKKN